MRLIRILQSRAIRFGLASYTPLVFLPDLIRSLVELLSFFEFPTTVEALSAEDGINLRYGKYEDFVIDSMKIFGDALLLEASVSTIRLDNALDFIIEHLKVTFGLEVSENVAIRGLYSSRIEIQAGTGLKLFSDQLSYLSNAITQVTRAYGVQTEPYILAGLTIAADGSSTMKPGRFMIERRLNTLLTDNVYFAEAALSTEDHLRLLELIAN